MKAQHLIPALQVIESGLFSHRVAERGTPVEATMPAGVVAPDPGAVAITPSLKQLMALRAKAGQALADGTASGQASEALEVGQIRWIAPAAAGAIDWPVALLLPLWTTAWRRAGS